MTSSKIIILVLAISISMIIASDFVYASNNINFLNPASLFDNVLPNQINSNESLPTIPLDIKSGIRSLGNDSTPSFKQFLNTDNVSSSDLMSGLKSVAVLGINLFIIVIETTVGILRALLPFLQ